MLLIRSQFYNILMYLLILVLGIYYAIPALRSAEGAYRAIRRYHKINTWLLWNICEIEIEVRGKIPDEPALICAKHMSFLDIVVIAASLPRPQFIMKDELRFVPILGFYAKRIGCAPVKRGEGGKAVKDMIKSLGESGQFNAQTVIFPQGTRVLPNTNMPYKKGAAAIYKAFQLPAYMVATNVGVLWPRHSAFRYPGKMILEFLDERIAPGLDSEAFMNKISTRIEERSNELMAAYPAKSKT